MTGGTSRNEGGGLSGGKSEPPADSETFLAVTHTIAALSDLNCLDAGLLTGLHLEFAADTRSFARIFGVAHALVLRALEMVSGTEGLLRR